MAITVSTQMGKDLADRASIRQLVQNGRLQIYSGTQPLTADSASNGTLLATVTTSSGVFTSAILPQWEITLVGSAGSLDTVKVGGIEVMGSATNFTGDLATTAAAVAAKINTFYSILDCTAVSSGAVITVSGPINCGTALNALTLAITQTTLTSTVGNSGSPTLAGVAAINGLQFSFPADSNGYVGISGTWSGVGAATGTAAWFRFLCDGADAGTSATTTYRRFNGSITATGGSGDATLLNTAITSGQPITVDTFNLYVEK